VKKEVSVLSEVKKREIDHLKWFVMSIGGRIVIDEITWLCIHERVLIIDQIDSIFMAKCCGRNLSKL
jgi:hypothetical protein